MYRRYALIFLIFTIVYLATAKLGLALAAISGFATLFWLPSGLAVSGLLLYGDQYAPAILFGAFLANLTNGAPILVALGIGTGNMLEALIGAYLLTYLAVDHVFSRWKDILHLALVAILAANVSAIIGVTSLEAGHVIAPAVFEVTGQSWWIGDVLSIILIPPCVVALQRRYGK